MNGLAQSSLLAQQDKDFGDWGTMLTADAYTQNNPLLREQLANAGLNLDTMDYSKLSGGLTAPSSNGVWDQTKGILSNQPLMKGILGAGQLGLGLADYFLKKPMYDIQTKAAREQLNTAIAERDRINKTRANFDRALSPVSV